MPSDKFPNIKTKKATKKIAMVGMYGGMQREYNPGCFMVGQKTKKELQKRIPDAKIDVFSIDNKKVGQGIDREKMRDLELNFFGREEQLKLLNEKLSQYDAIVLGGDIIWGGDDVVADNDIFFVNSPQFLQSSKPIVLFNCVHTFYDDKQIEKQKKKFANAVSRAVYTSVRTKAIQKRLEDIGITGIEYVPDPVLDVDMNDFPREKLFLPTERDKPILGISIRDRLSKDLLDAMQELPLDDFDIVVFPYSRQYKNLETLRKIQERFGNKFKYFDQYLDPVQSYQFIGELDIFLNDTYHGVVASIVHGKPFISLDIETEVTSRKQQLLEAVGVDEKYNVRLLYDNPDNVSTLHNTIPDLIRQPLVYSPNTIQQIQAQIKNHYDKMAQHIIESAHI